MTFGILKILLSIYFTSEKSYIGLREYVRRIHGGGRRIVETGNWKWGIGNSICFLEFINVENLWRYADRLHTWDLILQSDFRGCLVIS